jgi:hypothetical protein
MIPMQLQPYAVALRSAGVLIVIALRSAGVLIVIALAAAAGAVVNGWRLEARHADALEIKAGRIHELELAAKDHESAVAQLRTAADAANTARQRAEQEAISQRAAAKTRDEWIRKLQGTCAENLKDAWGRM